MLALAAVAAIAGILIGRAFDVLGARLMAADPETAESTRVVARLPLWPPDLIRLTEIGRGRLTGTGHAELVAGLALLLLPLRFQELGPALHALTFTLVFLLLGFIDRRERVLPNAIILPAGLIALGLAIAGVGPGWRSAVVAGAAGLLIFSVVYWFGLWAGRRAGVSGGALGLGDVKLAALIGLVVGWPAVFPALFGGVIIGGVVIGALLLSGRVKLRSFVPYGPFLLIAAYLVLVFGQRGVP